PSAGCGNSLPRKHWTVCGTSTGPTMPGSRGMALRHRRCSPPQPAVLDSRRLFQSDEKRVAYSAQEPTNSEPFPHVKILDVQLDTLTECSDEELLAQFCLGQSDAFGVLLKRYEKELFGYLQRYLGDRNLADDVFQNTFLQLYTKIGTYEAGKPVRP